jgi:hypothetical protein
MVDRRPFPSGKDRLNALVGIQDLPRLFPILQLLNSFLLNFCAFEGLPESNRL